MRFNELPENLRTHIMELKPIEESLSFKQYLSANKSLINEGLRKGAFYQGVSCKDSGEYNMVELTPRQYRLFMTAKLRALFPSVGVSQLIGSLRG